MTERQKHILLADFVWSFIRDWHSALEYFQRFFDNEIIEQIAEFTNRNAAKKEVTGWKQTTPSEIKAFLAMVIISNNLLDVPREERYFFSSGAKSVFHTPGVRNIFPSRKRCFQLKNYTFFVDPEHERTEDETRDVLHKIRNLTAKILEKCFSLYNCHESISVDEGMVPFNGRLKIKVRMPDKPVKYGIKLFMSHCPQLVKDYNKFMGGVDLHDQMTCVSKSKRQMRWYMTVFIKLILMCVYNAFVIEGHYQPHQIPGHRKRDLLSFKDELCIQLIGDFPKTHANSNK